MKTGHSLHVLGLVLSVLVAALAGCSSPPGTTLIVVGMKPPGAASPSGHDAGAGPVADAGAPSGEGAAATGVPCDVAMMFASSCTSCHSDPPAPGALAGLVTYSDLMAATHEDPTKNEALLSLARMQDMTAPMPPSSLPPSAEVTVLQNWIDAGYPTGSCGPADAGSTDSGTPPPTEAGSSGVFGGTPAYAAASGGSGHHNAGQDCMSSCHDHGFTFAGTLYDLSGSAVSSAEVRLVDSKGVGLSVYTGSNGNFYTTNSWTGPATVGARNGGGTVQMIETVSSSSGACNHCHATGGSTTPIHLP